jgi:hypothetical protein
MAGRDQNRDSGIGNQTLDQPEEEQIQDPVLSDVSKDEDNAELEGLAVSDPGLDEQLGLDPAAPRIRPLPPLAPQPSPSPPPQPSPPPPQPQLQPQPPIKKDLKLTFGKLSMLTRTQIQSFHLLV